MYRIIGADGHQYGPVSAEQMRQWIAEGRINAQTMALAEGATEWKPVSSFPEFASLLGGGGYSPASTPQYQYPNQPTQFGAPQKTNAMAMTGMILGIASITVGLCCGGPLIAIAGIIFSSIGLSQINKNPTVEGGKGMAVAGLIISIVSLLLNIVWIFLAIGMGILDEMTR